MNIDKRWLWLPPVLGLLLVMGPLRPGSETASDSSAAAEAAAPQQRARRSAEGGSALQALTNGGRRDGGGSENRSQPAGPQRGQSLPAGVGSQAPAMPDLLQLGLTLAGVLAVGALGLYGLARLRGKRGLGAGDGPARIRQTLRLTAKSTLHVVEFDGRTILVGAGEQGVTLLGDAAGGADEAEVAERDDGVVLRDMVIPRPGIDRVASDEPARSREQSFREALEAAGTQR